MSTKQLDRIKSGLVLPISCGIIQKCDTDYLNKRKSIEGTAEKEIKRLSSFMSPEQLESIQTTVDNYFQSFS